MFCHAVVSEITSIVRRRCIQLPVRPTTSAMRLILRCAVVGFILLTGCASDTLFQSNFDPTPIGQPPAHVQPVGTANVDGPSGSVVVIVTRAFPTTPCGKWVQISRSNGPSVSGMQGNFSQFRGDGVYPFSTILYIPSRSGLATVQFETFNQPTSTVSSFLHLDFMQDNTVRLDDNDATKFRIISARPGLHRASDAEHQRNDANLIYRAVRRRSSRADGLQHSAALHPDGASVRRDQGVDGLPVDGFV